MPRQRNALILDFDFFTAIGGGQTFYRRVVERNPAIDFHYPSRGADLERASSLPANAKPFRFDATTSFRRLLKGLSQTDGIWVNTHYAQAVASLLTPLQGMHFHVADVPSFFPAAQYVRPLATGLGITVDTVALAMLGWNSVSCRNAYRGEVDPDVVAAFEEVEAECIAAADVRYVISDVEITQTPAQVPGVLRIDMHDMIEEAPMPSAEPPAEGPPDLWYVGRLDGAKGPDLFIELAARMPRRLYGRCLLTGPDNVWSQGERWSDQLKRSAAKAGLKIDYLGTLSDAELRQRVYCGRVVLVVPSRTDAFNYVALEALLNGCPVLLSQRTGAYEFLAKNHPEHLPASMAPDRLDEATEQLEKLLATYPAEAERRRRALLEKPFPRPRRGFIENVYWGRSPNN